MVEPNPVIQEVTTPMATAPSTPSDDRGDGAGSLSARARERLARPDVEVLRPPPPEDHEAVAEWRANTHAAWLAGDPAPEDCGHTEASIAGIRCLVAEAGTDGERAPTIVYCHGGGYALGSPEVAVPITERLAETVNVVSVGYRLAPEYPYPAGFDDCRTVFEQIRAERERVILAGDSAGANLALACVVDALANDRRGPDRLVLFSPHLDHARRSTSAKHSGREDVDAEASAWLRRAYCGSREPSDPAVSPLRADLVGLPPTLIQVGTADSALDQAVALARKARLGGSPLALDVWAGLWHTWHYHRRLPEADRALAEAAAFAIGPAEPVLD